MAWPGAAFSARCSRGAPSRSPMTPSPTSARRPTSSSSPWWSGPSGSHTSPSCPWTTRSSCCGQVSGRAWRGLGRRGQERGGGFAAPRVGRGLPAAAWGRRGRGTGRGFCSGTAHRSLGFPPLPHKEGFSLGSLLVAFRGVTGRLGDLWRGRGEHVQQGLPLGVCVFCLLPRLRPQPLSQAGLAMREAGAKTARSVLSTHPTAERVVREILGPGGGRGRGMGAAALESRRGSRPPSRPFSHLESGHDGLAAWKPVSAGTLGSLAQSSCQRASRDGPAGRCWAGAPPHRGAGPCGVHLLTRAPGLCWEPQEHRASPAPAGPTHGAGGQVAAGSEVGRGWAGLSGG